MQKEAILISACLLGVPCRYDGKSIPNDAVWQLAKTYRLIPVCPEVMGGLPTPREPMELQGDRVVGQSGADGTSAYRKGAQIALDLAKQYGCRAALLKERSPSCGAGEIHNGRFDGGMVPGNGITAACLLAEGIAVFHERQIDKLVAFLEEKA